MTKIIDIKSISAMAMTEDAGLNLRQKINDSLAEGNDVVLDFDGIDLFATPFFNSSIGYFILNLKPEQYQKKIAVKNLSDLGKETYGHSYQNAVSVLENKIDTERIGKITAETINEQ